MKDRTITILGINGHLGHHVARAFLDAGYRVIGMGRSNKFPIAGVEFVQGDANRVDDMKRAVAEASVVFNALNLPYDKWGHGAAEALTERVIEACSDANKTLLFPGNIYNYRATDRLITPELSQDPESERGKIRVAMEQLLADAAHRGRLQVLSIRSGNFYGSELPGDWFGQLILREANKGRVALNPARTVRNAWAYLPDLARAFLKVAESRGDYGTLMTFHFAGHLVNADEIFAAMTKAVPQRLTRVGYPWTLLTVMGVFIPVIRGLVQMRYLWEHEMGLSDERLEALLGKDFGTPFDTAIARVCARHFPESALASRAWQLPGCLAHGQQPVSAARQPE